MLEAPNSLFSIPIFFLFSAFSLTSGSTYNVLDYGAKSGGEIDSSKAFLDTWAAACTSTTSPLLYVPAGTFLLGSKTTFDGVDCKNSVTVQIDGTLVAPSDYTVVGNDGNWIVFEQTNGIVLTGGTFDGRGADLWSCKHAGNQCPVGATNLAFYDSNNIQISGVTSVNSQIFHVIIQECTNVNIKGLTISAPGDSPNTDGIHLAKSSNVNVTGSTIATGDDCISISSGIYNVWIEDIQCGPGHGISIGSLGAEPNEEGVQNVTVKHCTIQETLNGVRIKTWARPSTSYVKQVIFQNVTMVNAGNPIIIDQNYSPGSPDVGDSSGVEISGVTFQYIRGTSSTKAAISINCSPSKPCWGITLQDIDLTSGDQPAEVSCSNVYGSNVGTVVPAGCINKSIGK
ncbi:OLC1v1007911C1 [Oldenlandia corymbosa var. corymbosa]|uniref:OLC1v1007911C1 n=1 Tax=Oldenlandia corymbosa var. corymbosa TaxID=529605 RepID=A0AAV1DKE7_OLDCO|nr:OLC1v1007911C1 [Oldenlandia corymbosa var. corymbosa]